MRRPVREASTQFPSPTRKARSASLFFESADPDFLTDLHIEVIKIFCQPRATLALRNASLYKEVPFIGIIEPLIEKKRRFMALERRRRAVMLGAVAAVVLILKILALIPLRVAGTAQVAPDLTQVRSCRGRRQAEARVTVGGITVELSSTPGRSSLHPDDKITKGEVIVYYQAVADRMLPYLKDRPLTMMRFPDGVTGPRIVQKTIRPTFWTGSHAPR